MKFLLGNPIITLILILSVLGALASIYYKIDRGGYLRGVGECNLEKQEAINANIKIKEKQDAIIRADDITYIDSLRRGSF